MKFRIIYQDDEIVAIDKPSGVKVHPLEDNPAASKRDCLHFLRDQLGKWVYPAHRLDQPTSGVLIFALSAEMASLLGQMFASNQMKKTYLCVARGWTRESSGVFEKPLYNERKTELLDCATGYECLSKVELPIVSQEPFLTSRYSLLKVFPRTGRYHQIRRHFRSFSHPLIGDSTYGDRTHNQIFKEKLGISGLLLKAWLLEFTHPRTGQEVRLQSKFQHQWHKTFDLFGYCPFERFPY